MMETCNSDKREKTANRIIVGKSVDECPLERLTYSWEDNTKMNLRTKYCEHDR
jgi:hypothetical protein